MDASGAELWEEASGGFDVGNSTEDGEEERDDGSE